MDSKTIRNTKTGNCTLRTFTVLLHHQRFTSKVTVLIFGKCIKSSAPITCFAGLFHAGYKSGIKLALWGTYLDETMWCSSGEIKVESRRRTEMSSDSNNGWWGVFRVSLPVERMACDICGMKSSELYRMEIRDNSHTNSVQLRFELNMKDKISLR